MLEFYLCASDGCVGCQALVQTASLVAQRYEFKLSYISDVEEVACLAKRYELVKLPALLLMVDGVFQGAVYGYQPYEILAYWVEGYLK